MSQRSGALDRRLGEPVDHRAQGVGVIGAGSLRLPPDRQLPVRAGPFAQDAAGALHLGRAAEVVASSAIRPGSSEAMEGRGLGSTAENQYLARHVALMTRAAKRGCGRDTLRRTWARQAVEIGLRREYARVLGDGTRHGRGRQGARRGEAVSFGKGPDATDIEPCTAELRSD